MNFTSYNPATLTPVWQGTSATKQDIEQAIQNAHRALPSWRKIPFVERASFCQKFASLLTQNKESFARIISEEMGKPFWESLTEVQAMINKVEISIDAYNTRCKEQDELLGKTYLRTRYFPYGIVAVLGPFNFPGHLPNGHIVPALLAGNVILFKPSELTPRVGEMMVKLWYDAGLPSDVLILLQGSKEVAEEIIAHKEIRGIYFTGSVTAGLSIEAQSRSFPYRILALEMGGNNPLVVSKVSDQTATSFTIIQSAFLTSGQRCSCARRLILLDDAVLDPLIKMTNALRVGAYDAHLEPFMGPVVSKQAADKLEASYKALLDKGGKAIIPLRRNDCFLRPAIVDMSGIESEDTELFGPILQISRVKNFEEAMVEANKTSFGLVAGLISDDPSEYEHFLQDIRAGVINWNMPTTGASSRAPFGGLGLSGNHRPSGYLAADYTAYPVASQEQTTISLPEKLPPGITLP